MKAETNGRLLYLDGWRGIAILAVLVGHFWTDMIFPGLSTLGVDLFFVLSGRLMAEILFVQKADLGTFFLRRFSRVYPALLVFVVLVTIAFHQSSYGHSVLAALSALTFTINYSMIFGNQTGVIDHLWSLCVEEHGYVILALAALAVRRGERSAILVLLGLGMAALVNGIVQSILTGDWHLNVSWRTDVQVAPLFLAGAAYLLVRRSPALQRAWISPVCLVVGVAAKLMGTSVAVHFGLGTVMIAIAVATLDHSAAVVRRALEPALLRQVGLWSFSLYLWQQPFYKLAVDGVMPPLAMLAAALGLSLLSFYGVEGPARRFINRRWARLVAPRPHAPAPAVPGAWTRPTRSAAEPPWR